jgi:hypothetical protein
MSGWRAGSERMVEWTVAPDSDRLDKFLGEDKLGPTVEITNKSKSQL